MNTTLFHLLKSLLYCFKLILCKSFFYFCLCFFEKVSADSPGHFTISKNVPFRHLLQTLTSLGMWKLPNETKQYVILFKYKSFPNFFYNIIHFYKETFQNLSKDKINQIAIFIYSVFSLKLSDVTSLLSICIYTLKIEMHPRTIKYYAWCGQLVHKKLRFIYCIPHLNNIKKIHFYLYNQNNIGAILSL